MIFAQRVFSSRERASQNGPNTQDVEVWGTYLVDAQLTRLTLTGERRRFPR